MGALLIWVVYLPVQEGMVLIHPDNRTLQQLKVEQTTMIYEHVALTAVPNDECVQRPFRCALYAAHAVEGR